MTRLPKNDVVKRTEQDICIHQTGAMTDKIVSDLDLTATVNSSHAAIGLPGRELRRVMSPRKLDQEQWLAEARVALAEAERLTCLLAVTQPWHDLTLAALQSRIIELRRELERLQRARGVARRRELQPDWTELSAWTPVR